MAFATVSAVYTHLRDKDKQTYGEKKKLDTKACNVSFYVRMSRQRESTMTSVLCTFMCTVTLFPS